MGLSWGVGSAVLLSLSFKICRMSSTERPTPVSPSTNHSRRGAWKVPRRSVMSQALRPGCSSSYAEVGSHGYDLDEIAERAEIFRVAGAERQAGGARGRCKEEVNGTSPPRLASRGYHSGINPPVSACRLSVEGQRIERGFRALEPVLATRPLFGVWCGVRTGGKLGHRDCADGNLDRKPCRLYVFEVDDHRGVEEPASRPPVRHRVQRPGQPTHRHQPGSGPGRWRAHS